MSKVRIFDSEDCRMKKGIENFLCILWLMPWALSRHTARNSGPDGEAMPEALVYDRYHLCRSASQVDIQITIVPAISEYLYSYGQMKMRRKIEFLCEVTKLWNALQ